MRVDAHQHFWDLDRFTYAWMPGPPSRLRRNFLPRNLEPILRAHRFDGSVVVQANTLHEETRWLLDLASEHVFILGVVGWVDLTAADLPARLDEFQKHPKFKGVRHPVHDEPDPEWLLREPVIEGLRELARRGLPYDLLLQPRHLPLVPRLADRVPGLRMAIDHIAKPPIVTGRLNGWADDMARAAQVPNLWCKLSGMITEADHAHWQPSDLRPYLKHVLRVFPPDRLMFGSDWPVCLPAGTWKRVLAGFTQATSPIPTEIRNAILGENAMKFYGLEKARDAASGGL
ncbi:MAG: amidohydrolase family protein [Bryobacteraceae bacterium]